MSMAYVIEWNMLMTMTYQDDGPSCNYWPNGSQVYPDYHILLGWPWVHKHKLIPSTFHKRRMSRKPIQTIQILHHLLNPKHRLSYEKSTSLIERPPRQEEAPPTTIKPSLFLASHEEGHCWTWHMYQVHTNLVHAYPIDLTSITTSWLFHNWGLHIIGFINPTTHLRAWCHEAY